MYTAEQVGAIQGSYVTADPIGDRLLLIQSRFQDIVAGELRLYLPASDSIRVLVPQDRHVSSAVFWPGHPDRIVFYQYGADLNAPVAGEGAGQAGFRVLDLQTGQDTPLLAHAPASAVVQVVAGFDMSPDGRTLLYALVRDDGRGAVVPPAIILHDIELATADTLEVAGLDRPGLWLRYHPDGRHAVFANIPEGALTENTPAGSVLGVLDLQSDGTPLTPRLVDPVYPRRPTEESVVVMPEWSPDGRGLLVGRSPLFPGSDGGRGFASLYYVPNVMIADAGASTASRFLLSGRSLGLLAPRRLSG